MDAGWAFVICGSFGFVHVSVSWKTAVDKFDNEDLGALLKSVECLSWWNIPVDGSEGVAGPVVPFHELLANSCGLLAACHSCWAN